MSITLTEPAARRVRAYLNDRRHGIGLRLGIKKTGCSGFAYVVGVAEELAEHDALFEHRGVKIVVNSEHLALLAGTEVDFVRQGLNETFSFRNPNVTGECGCGESFSV